MFQNHKDFQIVWWHHPTWMHIYWMATVHGMMVENKGARLKNKNIVLVVFDHIKMGEVGKQRWMHMIETVGAVLGG